MAAGAPDIEQLKKSLYRGLMALVEHGDLSTGDIAPMLRAFGELPAEKQTADRFARMLESARRRNRRSPAWRPGDTDERQK
ncbi:MAG: hypothetical protein ACOCZU_02790 [Planctomycetota bacterium]